MDRPTLPSLEASYRPPEVEKGWYAWWEAQGFFQPDATVKDSSSAESFVMPLPPPNTTGSCHNGHALTLAIQDALVRWHRMQGHRTLWIPGCDHAGIATQVVVEKSLAKAGLPDRHALGREAFLEHVWTWKNTYGDRIYEQIRRLGASLDWTRAAFTLDEARSIAVTEAFVTLHERGLIYRAQRLVNWDATLRTALSNLEIEKMHIKGRTKLTVPGHDPKRKYEFGTMTYFAYQIDPLAPGEPAEEIVVATTRLETMLADTGIAVHPEDPRHLHLHGRFAVHPFHRTRRLPIVTDAKVDKELGTGAVKLTPAHDAKDFETAQTCGLPMINLFNDDGTLNEEAGGQFAGMKRFDARFAVLTALKEKGLFRDLKDHEMDLPICTRSGDIVEPVLRPQWWVRCDEMAKKAMDVVESGELTITPNASKKEWSAWLTRIQDWCISRQLWWGHRIPAYRVLRNGSVCTNDDGANVWVSGRSEEEAREKAATLLGISIKDVELEQDPDVLDTWFSSGLWPFSTLGWPNTDAKDFTDFYPTTMLETGWDILFFWVARMVMMGIELTGRTPFRQVFCHAMVRDAHGEKMSKSKGNVIDPLDAITGVTLQQLHDTLTKGNLSASEIKKARDGQKRDYPKGIPECGTDALRFALCAYTHQGRAIHLNILRVEGYRKFCNKIWNATKFVLLKLGDEFTPAPTAPDATSLSSQKMNDVTLMQRWILSKLSAACIKTHQSLTEFNFMEATTAAHSFWLYEFCDVFIEASKLLLDNSTSPQDAATTKEVLYTGLEFGLGLLHPFMPYVTEALWQHLPRRAGDKTPSLMVSRWPVAHESWAAPETEVRMQIILEVVHTVRSMLSDSRIRNAPIVATAESEDLRSLLREHAALVVGLTRNIGAFDVAPSMFEGSTELVTMSCKIGDDTVKLALIINDNVDVSEEVARLQKQALKCTEAAERLRTSSSAKNNEASESKLQGLHAEVSNIESLLQKLRT